MGAGALAPGRVCTEFPKDKEFRAFEMLEKIGFSLKPRRCATCECNHRVSNHRAQAQSATTEVAVSRNQVAGFRAQEVTQEKQKVLIISTSGV
jgi:hypothetical protein